MRTEYLGQTLTDHPVRQDGSYWVRVLVLDPVVGFYVSQVHAGTGKWYGLWQLPGTGCVYIDSDFSYIGAESLKPPKEIARFGY